MWPELAEIDHKEIGIGGGGCYLTEQEHPSHLNAHSAPEGGASVQVRATGLLEPRSDLGKAAEDHAHPSSGQENGDGTQVSQQACDSGRQPENAAADYGVHYQRSQAPAANGANQLLAMGDLGERFGHRVVLSQVE